MFFTPRLAAERAAARAKRKKAGPSAVASAKLLAEPFQPAEKLRLNLREIEASHPEITGEELKNLQELSQLEFSRPFNIAFGNILSLPYADHYEAKFNLLGGALNTIHENQPENYYNAFLSAIDEIFASCITRRQNKFAVFAKVLVEQAKNVAAQNEKGYLQKLMQLIFETSLWMECYNKEQLDRSNYETTPKGGDDVVYRNTAKWPLHVIWASANAGLDLIAEHILSRLPHLLKPEDGIVKVEDISRFVIGVYSGENSLLVKQRLLSVRRALKEGKSLHHDTDPAQAVVAPTTKRARKE